MTRRRLGLFTAMLLAAALPARAQVSGDSLRIGVLTDLTGLYADNTGTGTVEAARMAVEDFGGSVLGKPIELLVADHKNDATVAAAIARAWIDDDNVAVITNVGNSSVALTVQEIARERNRILLNTAAGTSDFTGSACSPVGFDWTYDTYALASGTGRALTQQGGATWFFLTADYSYGHALERDTSEIVRQAGGKVLGDAMVPLNNQDFSSYLLQASESRAKVIGLANAGGDFIKSVKQAAEYGIMAGGQRLAALHGVIQDIRALGLKTAQGLVVTDFGYWDMNDETRAFSKRFMERHGTPPNYIQMNDYGAVLHYLKSVRAAGTDEATAVAHKMRQLKINDPVTRNGWIREDGRVMRDAWLMQVKTPDESRGPWDFYQVLARIPAEQSVRPLDMGGCPLVSRKE